MVGLVSYGVYLPKYRIRTGEIAAAWKKEAGEVTSSLGISEKSVPAADEDAVTIALSAARRCLLAADIKPNQIRALMVGSESHPYAVNPTSTIVGEFLGVGRNYLAADLEFACKAATAGLLVVSGLAASGHIDYGMVVGADTAQGKPHDALEYTSAAGGAAFVVGTKDVAAELIYSSSFTSDTPDFWRRDGIRYPTHAGRFTGEPAYFNHVIGAARELFSIGKIGPADCSYCVFHMPNGKFPRDVAKRLGFTLTQLAPSLTVSAIGNPYSASSLIGLAAVLDIIRPGQTVFMVSYGSGAGSDAFYWRATERIVPLQRTLKSRKQTFRELADDKTYINYIEYLKKTQKI